MNIDEGKLQDLLHQRKQYIRTSGDVVASAIALGGYIVTIILADIGKLALWAKIVVAVMGLVYIALLVRSIYSSRYSVEAFFKDITACTNEHNFSLLILKDSHGRFLLKKDSRWKTYLFPYVRSKENDEDSVRDFAKASLNLSQISIEKKEESDFTKRSVSANMTKTYHHTFYKLSFDQNQLPQKDCFKISGTKYKWFSFDEMKANKGMMLKNSDNITFVEKKF